MAIVNGVLTKEQGTGTNVSNKEMLCAKHRNRHEHDQSRVILMITLCNRHHSPHFTVEESEVCRWYLKEPRAVPDVVAFSSLHFSLPLPMALFGVQIHCDTFLTFLSDKAMVKWSISLGKCLPEIQSFHTHGQESKDDESLLSRMGIAVHPSVVVRIFPFHVYPCHQGSTG